MTEPLASTAPFGTWFQTLGQNEQETLEWVQILLAHYPSGQVLPYFDHDLMLLFIKLAAMLDVLEREKLDLMKQLSSTYKGYPSFGSI